MQHNLGTLHCSHSPTLERHNDLGKATQKTKIENTAKETRRKEGEMKDRWKHFKEGD